MNLMLHKYTIAMLIMLSSILIGCIKIDIAPISISNNIIKSIFGTNIDLNHLLNYANQDIPNHILKRNSTVNIADSKATLGRVLFYDPSLSVSNMISCATCHQQKFAFGDTTVASIGIMGALTTRHSMRLVNNRFGNESRYFWDERASSLEDQITQPIVNVNELGYSGTGGRPDINTLVIKLNSIGYYKPLFGFVYGDSLVTVSRLIESISHFIRSIQSFDSKYDSGRSKVNSDIANFPNFTVQENLGKTLFLTNPVFDQNGSRISGGVGCNNCHRAPEFDIDPNSRNNGVIQSINSASLDLSVVKSPTLRNILKQDGTLFTPLMHNGGFSNMNQVLAHYANLRIDPANNNIDRRLVINGNGQKLNLTNQEIGALVSFLKTLTGNAVFNDSRWSNPFISRVF